MPPEAQGPSRRCLQDFGPAAPDLTAGPGLVVALSLALLLALPPAALAEEEEAIPDLPVVQAPVDPVRDLVGLAANPQLAEEEGQRYFEDLVRRGEVALPSLASLFLDPASSDREAWVAARALGRIGGAGARETLVAGLESQRVICRLGAVSALTTLADKEAAGALERALFDQAMTVRSAAADALGTLGSRRSSKALSDALDLPANFHHGKSLFVRQHIIMALGAIGSIYGIDVLVKSLHDPEVDIQLAALSALEGTTGLSFRDASVIPGSPPSDSETEAWTAWWSKRKVGQVKDSGSAN